MKASKAGGLGISVVPEDADIKRPLRTLAVDCIDAG